MGDTREPPPGGGPPHNISPPHAYLSNPTTPASGGGSSDKTPYRMRNFAEILNDEQHHRNILEVKLIRKSETINGELIKSKTLSEADISELLFDIIKLKVEDCEGIALRTYRYDTKEIKLKRGTNPTPYLITSPITFKGHEVTVKKQMNNLTRVTFKNVPFNIPDEEIIHLCKVYGEPLNNKVNYERPTLNTRSVPGSTRFVEMKLNPGAQFENYYWMEGPLAGDAGCRITVLHNGQVQQCSHCLRRATLCPGGGNGKACEAQNTIRAKMSDYMSYLKEKQGYISLKMQYLELQFPALGGADKNEGGFGHMEDPLDIEDTEVKKDEIEELRIQLSDMHEIQQELVETKARLNLEQKNTRTATLKLQHVEKVATQRLVESMPNSNFDEDSNHLAMLLATVLEKEDFQYDLESDTVELKAENEFLKRIEDNCGEFPDKEEKISMVRNKVLEKMKRTLRRERRLSGGSVGSVVSRSSSKTRCRSNEEDSMVEHTAKHSKHHAGPNPPGLQSKLPGPVSSKSQN